MASNLNTKQVMALAGVSHMTVYQWRAGSKTKAPLPAYEGTRPGSVEFKPGELRTWARKYGVELLEDPVAVARGDVELPKSTNKKAAKKSKRAAKRTRH